MTYDDFLNFMKEDIAGAGELLKSMPQNFYNAAANAQLQSKSVYAFTIDANNEVTREPEECKWDAIESRVISVHSQLQRIARFINIQGLKIFYEFEDMTDDRDIPIFSFHKRVGQLGVIVVPDFEIFEQNYYHRRQFIDPLTFLEKINMAIFVGSTTGTNQRETRGCQNTRENIDNDPSVRVSAAKHFSNSDQVIFRLPNIVQCDNGETEAYLRSFDFCKPRYIGWQEQFAYKYIISVDGNGPTLSRVAIALLSNSLLLKYRSDWISYYHRALQEGVNYIEIKEHSDIEKVVSEFEHNHVLYNRIAENSASLFSSLLTRSNVERYYAAVLNEFRALICGSDDIYNSNRKLLNKTAHLDIDAHISNIGDISFWPEQEISSRDGNCIEGICIYPASAALKWSDIRYQVMFIEGDVSDICFGGEFCGTRNQSRYIKGFRLKINSYSRLNLAYRIEFLDGTILSAVNGCWISHPSSPIIKISIELS